MILQSPAATPWPSPKGPPPQVLFERYFHDLVNKTWGNISPLYKLDTFDWVILIVYFAILGTLAVYGGLSRDVADSALMLNVLTRPDARDSFAIPYRGIDYLDGLDDGVAGMKIAWSPDLGFPGLIIDDFGSYCL